jgi:hypothetical protein
MVMLHRFLAVAHGPEWAGAGDTTIVKVVIFQLFVSGIITVIDGDVVVVTGSSVYETGAGVFAGVLWIGLVASAVVLVGLVVVLKQGERWWWPVMMMVMHHWCGK